MREGKLILLNTHLERFLFGAAAEYIEGTSRQGDFGNIFSTGLRISELCDLDRYMNLSRGEISVRGKGEKIRVVFLSDRARATIKIIWKKERSAGAFI